MGTKGWADLGARIPTHSSGLLYRPTTDYQSAGSQLGFAVSRRWKRVAPSFHITTSIGPEAHTLGYPSSLLSVALVTP
ncbi:MAG: hypothetical protein EP343_04695 [Deltaproteobacteria bacterium]|nr:MAG: hypothetical protein EP343_04695 [Deltaproteobacteria bacterium]